MGCMTTKAPDDPQAHPARRRGARTKGDEREDQILSAMRSLLADHPIDDVTIDDISSAAGISRTSFYFYFPSKQAVLTTLMERIWDDFASTHDWFDADGPDADGLREQLGAVAAIWKTNGSIMACAARTGYTSGYAPLQDFLARARARFVERLAAKIERDRSAGLAPDGPPAADLALLVAVMRDAGLSELTSSTAAPAGDGQSSTVTTADDDAALDTLTIAILRMIYGRID